MNETRVSSEYLKENKINEEFFPNYYTYWNNSVEKKGYSGVSILTKKKAKTCKFGLDSESHDQEGRVITLNFDDFYLVAVYVPNSGEGLKRLTYRVNLWDQHFFNYLNKLKKKKNVIVTGDFNVAHQDIDIYDPSGKDKQPGFTVQERKSFQSLLDMGYVDTFRNFYPQKKEFTFWANRSLARLTDSGWRLDYFLASEKFQSSVKDSLILKDHLGSDHCPIKLELK